MPATSSARRLALLCGLLVATLACWNCRAVLHFPLVVWDDDVNLALNPFLGGPTWARLQWMFTDIDYMRRYVPLGWLGFSGVYAFTGLSGGGFHAANLVFHTLNTVLLYGVLRRALRRWQPVAEETWRIAVATLGAAAWALHPFRVETVAWASGLLYGLAACFALLAVYAYLALDGRARLPVTFFFYVCSILTYPVAIGCWAIFVLIDFADRPRAWRSLALGKAVLLVPAILVMAVNVHARFNPNEFWAGAPDLHQLSAASRALRAGVSIVYYVAKPFWPTQLTPVPTWLVGFDPAAFGAIASTVLVVAVTCALGLRAAWRRGPLLLWLGFLALLVPALGATEQMFFPCDRYDYLPTMVASLALALLLLRVPARGRGGAWVLVAFAVGALAVRQRAQLSVWRDTDALYARIVGASDNPAITAAIYRRWVKLHLQRWDLDRAREVLAEAEEKFPDNAMLTPVAASMAGYVDAKRRLERGEDVPTELATVPALHEEVARAYGRGGEFREAREQFEAALAWAPRFAPARFNFAIACALEGKPDEALHRYLGAVANGAPAISAGSRQRALGLIASSFEAAGRSDAARRVRALAQREAR